MTVEKLARFFYLVKLANEDTIRHHVSSFPELIDPERFTPRVMAEFLRILTSTEEKYATVRSNLEKEIDSLINAFN